MLSDGGQVVVVQGQDDGVHVVIAGVCPASVNLLARDMLGRVDRIHQPYQPLKEFVLCSHIKILVCVKK